MNGTERDKASDPGVSSLGDALKDLSRSVFELLGSEVRLAAGEVSQKVSRAGKDSQFVAVGASIIYAGFLLVLASAVIALSALIPLGWAALIVGFAAMAAGAITVRIGKKRLGEEDFLPRETLNSLREDTKWMRNQLM